MTSFTDTLQVRVEDMKREADETVSLDLRSPDGSDLPPFTAGAHIDLHLPGAVIRAYSLFNDPRERHRYMVAVQRDANSRGGSRYINDELRTGDPLIISHPRNNFALDEQAPHSILIAGGIGITPILCMARRLQSIGHSWQVYYAARSRRHAAFIDELVALAGTEPQRIATHFDDEHQDSVLDLKTLFASEAASTHLYCCGPALMLSAFEQATASRNPATTHVEYFKAKETSVTSGSFKVELAKSGRTIDVPPGKTIIEVLLAAGIPVTYSCAEGVCGACETPVLEGIPDHRDLVLSKEEHAANKTMMVCVSGCKSERLVLDI